MVEVGMRMKDVRDGQAELPHLVENALRRSSGIDDDGLPGEGIADDRAIASERWNRECFSNQRSHIACYRSTIFRRKQRTLTKLLIANRPDHFRIIEDPITPLSPEPD